MATEGHASDVQPLVTNPEEERAEANVGHVNNVVYEESCGTAFCGAFGALVTRSVTSVSVCLSGGTLGWKR